MVSFSLKWITIYSRVQITLGEFLNFHVVFEKNDQTIDPPPLLWLAHVWKILDPPLLTVDSYVTGINQIVPCFMPVVDSIHFCLFYRFYAYTVVTVCLVFSEGLPQLFWVSPIHKDIAGEKWPSVWVRYRMSIMSNSSTSQRLENVGYILYFILMLGTIHYFCFKICFFLLFSMY